VPFFDDHLLYNKYKDGMKEFSPFLRKVKGICRFALPTHTYRRVAAHLYPFFALTLYGDKFLSHNVTDVMLTALTQFTDKL